MPSKDIHLSKEAFFIEYAIVQRGSWCHCNGTTGSFEWQFAGDQGWCRYAPASAHQVLFVLHNATTLKHLHFLHFKHDTERSYCHHIQNRKKRKIEETDWQRTTQRLHGVVQTMSVRMQRPHGFWKRLGNVGRTVNGLQPNSKKEPVANESS